MKTGDKVVCIKNDYNGYFNVDKGKIYIIKDILVCPCGLFHIDIGMSNIIDIGICDCGKEHEARISFFDGRYFRPISYNSAHDELINKDIIEEKSDIEVPEKIEA